MTKAEIIAMAKQNSLGGIPDRTSGIKFGNRVIQHYINMARKQTLIDNIIEAPITDNYLKTFFPYVQWDRMRSSAYFILPASTVHLVDQNGDDLGLQYVSGKDDEEDGWIIRRNMEGQYMNNLEGGNHSKQICYLEGNKVFLPRILKSSLSEKLCVKIKIVPDLNGYSDNEEVAIPVKAAAFFDMVGKLMERQRAIPTKTGNDGNVLIP